MVCHLGQEGEIRGLGDIWVERWGREKVEKQVSRGPLHVLDRKGTEVWLLRGRQKEQTRVYVIPALLKNLPGTVLVYVCCPSIIINGTLFNFPDVSQFR